MSGHPTLINIERASELVSKIENRDSQDALRLIVEGIKRFFREQPSQLQSPFDLAFFFEILRDRIENVRNALNGAEAEDQDLDLSKTYAVPDPASDVSDTGVRQRQAGNYVASCVDRRVQSALRYLETWAYTRQRPNAKYVSGAPLKTLFPDQPLDYLFLVMAVDHALRPGQPARLLLEQETSANTPK